MRHFAFISKSLCFPTQKRFIFFAAIFIVLSGSIQTFAVCAEKSVESKWIEQTLQIWEKSRKDSLILPAARLPWIILFDESCVWHINPELSLLKINNPAESRIPFNRKFGEAYLVSHAGKITLPNNDEIPAQLLSFASSYGSDKKSFMISAMPSVWQKAPHLKEEKNIEALVRGVFVHEMTHTLHRNFYSRLDEIETQLAAPENFDDDIIQNTFGKTEEFRKAYEIEHDLLYQAAGENKLSRKRELAKTALDSIRARRKQFFSGKDSVYAEIEEIFLTMEGAANWAAYQAAMQQGLSEQDALRLIRRSGKHWSQDEGLALFVVINSLLPKWQKKAFGKSAATVTDLLAEAVR